MSKKKFAIFLSYTNADDELAEGLQHLIEECLSQTKNLQLVFRAGDLRAIEGGSDWYPTTLAAVQASKICLALLTPNSLYHRPWLLYETGVAYATGSTRVIGLHANGIAPADVPTPLKRFQARGIETEKEITHLLKELGRLLKVSVSLKSRAVRAVADLAHSRGQRWDSVTPTLVAENAGSSPFNLEVALRIARSRVIVFGQNLQWAARSKEWQNSVVAFLKQQTGRQVDLVINDEREKEAVKAWAAVNPDLEHQYPFSVQLAESTKAFRSLGERCYTEKAEGFTLHAYPLVPFGATVIDPATGHGVIAIHPAVNHCAKPSERPQFLILRSSNPRLYNYYWRTFEFMLRYSEKLG